MLEVHVCNAAWARMLQSMSAEEGTKAWHARELRVSIYVFETFGLCKALQALEKNMLYGM